MTLSDLVAVAIGLVLTYTVLSLIASQMKEAIAGARNWRTQQLAAALKLLVTEVTVPPAAVGQNPPPATNVFSLVYTHALVSGDGKTKPSFVPARNFTLALLSAIGNGDVATSVDGLKMDVNALPDGKLKQTLTALIAGGSTEIESVRTQIDNWFNASMDILTSQYKAHAQFWTFILGLILAAAFNVDTVNIVTALEKSADLRSKIVSEATVAPAQAPSTLAGLIEQLEALPIPIGWPTCGSTQPCPPAVTQFWSAGLIDWLLRIVGWVLTGAAVSLGAPFWFDLLNQLVGRDPSKNDTPA